MSTKIENGDTNTEPVPFEEAITLAGFGKFNHLITCIGGMCIFAVIVGTVDVAYALPVAECDLNLSSTDKGYISSSYFIGIIVSSHLIGYLSDTRGRRKVLSVSVLFNGILYMIASFSPEFWTLLVIRFLIGVAICSALVAGVTYVGEFHSVQHKTKALMLASALSSLAFIYCAGIGWLIIPGQWSIPIVGRLEYNSWRLYYALCGLPSIITGIILFYLPESPRFLLANQRKEESLQVLQKLFAGNTGNPPNEFPVKCLAEEGNEYVTQLDNPSTGTAAIFRSMWNQTYPLFLPPHVLNMFLCCVIFYMICICLNGVLLWVPYMMNRINNYGDTNVAGTKFCDMVMENNVLVAVPNVSTRMFAMFPESVESLNPLEAKMFLQFLEPFKPAGNVNISEAATTAATMDTEFQNVTQSCKAELRRSVFSTNLIFGVIMPPIYIVMSYIMPLCNKKIVTALLQVCLGLLLIGLTFVTNPFIIMCYLGAIPIVTGVVFYALTSVIIDYFPTNFRAMALCIGMMFGRIGSVTGSYLLSLLLLTHCSLTFYVVSAFQIANDTIEAAEYDEALKHAGYGKFNIYIIFTCGMCLFSSLLSSFDISYLLPITECEFHLSPFQKGLLSSSFFAGLIIISQLGGFLSDVMGRQYIVIRAMALNSITYCIAIFTPNFTLLLFIKFCSGLLICVGMTVPLSYIGECSTHNNRTRNIMLVTTLGSFSVVYLTVAAWLILPYHWSFSLGWITLKPWRLLIAVCGLPSVITGFLVYRIPESPKFELACGHNDAALKILQCIYSLNTRKPTTDYPVKSLLQNPNDRVTVNSSKNICRMFKQMLSETLTLLKPPFTRNFLLCCCVMFSTLYCLSSAILWLPEVTNEISVYGEKCGHTYSTFCKMVPKKIYQYSENISHFHSEMRGESYLNSTIMLSTNKTQCDDTIKNEVFLPNLVIAVSQTTSMLVISFFIHKFNKKWTIVLLLLLCSVVYLSLFLIPNGYMIILFFGVTAVLAGVNYNLLANLVVDIFPTNVSCLAVSLTMMCGRLGSMVGSNLFSVLIGQHCNVMLGLSCGLNFVCSILATFFKIRNQRQKQKTGETKTANA